MFPQSCQLCYRDRMELDEVRRHAAAARRETEARDEAIRAARAAGFTLRAIAEAAGLTHTGVQRVVRRTETGANPA